MRERIQARIDDLKRDFETGQGRLAAIEREAVQLRETMLRISGAIQVLQETLAEDGGEAAAGPRAAA